MLACRSMLSCILALIAPPKIKKTSSDTDRSYASAADGSSGLPIFQISSTHRLYGRWETRNRALTTAPHPVVEEFYIQASAASREGGETNLFPHPSKAVITGRSLGH